MPLVFNAVGLPEPLPDARSRIDVEAEGKLPEACAQTDALSACGYEPGQILLRALYPCVIGCELCHPGVAIISTYGNLHGFTVENNDSRLVW